MNCKPVLYRDAKTVLKLDAEAFAEKLLCDGLMLFNAVCWSPSASDEIFAIIERQYLSLSEYFQEVMSLASHVGPPQNAVARHNVDANILPHLTVT